jgi:hypothetical protein
MLEATSQACFRNSERSPGENGLSPSEVTGFRERPELVIVFRIFWPMRDSEEEGRHGGVSLPTDGLPPPSLNGRVLKPIWTSIVSAEGSKVNDEDETNGRSLEEVVREVDQSSE